MISYKDILQDLYTAVKDICQKTYLQDRPKSISDKIDSYAVIAAPFRIYNRVMESRFDYDYMRTTVQIAIFVRNRTNAANLDQVNINAIDEKVKALMEKFPIKGSRVMCDKPSMLAGGDDESGFHYVLVHASLRIL